MHSMLFCDQGLRTIQKKHKTRNNNLLLLLQWPLLLNYVVKSSVIMVVRSTIGYRSSSIARNCCISSAYLNVAKRKTLE